MLLRVLYAAITTSVEQDIELWNCGMCTLVSENPFLQHHGVTHTSPPNAYPAVLRYNILNEQTRMPESSYVFLQKQICKRELNVREFRKFSRSRTERVEIPERTHGTANRRFVREAINTGVNTLQVYDAYVENTEHP